MSERPQRGWQYQAHSHEEGFLSWVVVDKVQCPMLPSVMMVWVGMILDTGSKGATIQSGIKEERGSELTLLINCLCVGAGGFIGSILRYLMGYFAPVSTTGFPFTTFLINASGAFAIAFIATFFMDSLDVDHQVLLFLRVGLCGGFTTFSAFTLESMQLIEKGDLLLAAAYVVASCLVCLVLAFAGQAVAGMVLSKNG